LRIADKIGAPPSTFLAVLRKLQEQSNTPILINPINLYKVSTIQLDVEKSFLDEGALS